MLRIKRGALICAALSMLMCVASEAQPEGKPETPNAEAGVAAYIGGKAITIVEVDAKALGTNMKLAQTLFEARQEALDQIIMERLLSQEAAAQGIALEALISKRLAEKAAPVTDEDVEAFYNANSSRMRGQTLEAVSDAIRQYLASQRTSEARQSLLDELMKKSDVRITLDPPRIEVKIAANDPVRGPAGAKVTIVQYMDFQ